MEPIFKIYSGVLKTYVRDGKKRLRTTASSSIKDLQGDEIREDAIGRMAQSAKQKGLTIFLNHSYRVPEDIFGYTEDAVAVRRSAEDGSPVADMDLDTVLNESNPRAVETFNAIDKEGVKLGVSIGALIKDWEYRDKKNPSAGVIIKDVELLEASIVGIPANPRSWVQHAMKSLNLPEVLSADATISPLYTDAVEQMAAQMMSIGEAGPETILVLNKETGKEEEEEVVEVIDAADFLEAAGMCPDCGKPKSASGCSNSFHSKTVEPDKTDARVTVSVDVDTSRKPAQETPVASDPDDAGLTESADEAPTEHIAKQLESLDGELTSQALTMLKEMVGVLVERSDVLQKENAELRADNEELTANLETAKTIVERIANLPIGRKTSYSAAVNDFRESLSGIYSDEFLKYLEN